MDNDYDIILIGAGSGGLTGARFAASLGARVALVEKGRIGGDCTWTGCIPSKALLHVAKTAAVARRGNEIGVNSGPVSIDMKAVKAYVQSTIASIYEEETPEKLRAEGIDVIEGHARFVDPQHIQVGDKRFRGANFIVATGATPIAPEITGLSSVTYETYETIFGNERLPEHLIVIGAGAIGVELAQAYRRLGAEVTIIDIAMLPLFPAEIGQRLQQRFASEGVMVANGFVSNVRQNGADIVVSIGASTEEAVRDVVGDMLLVATGRRPTVEGIGLDAAGVAYTADGITVDNQLRTSVAHIFAAGDCTGGPQLTPYAGWQAFQAVRNALLPGNSPGIRHGVGQVVFTDPEIATVGMDVATATRKYGEQVQIARREMLHVDRAVTDRQVDGFLEVVYLQSGKIVGATMMAERAGEAIGEFAIAIQNKLTLSELASTLHPYPTYGSGIQRLLADVATDQFVASKTGRFLTSIRRFTSR